MRNILPRKTGSLVYLHAEHWKVFCLKPLLDFKSLWFLLLESRSNECRLMPAGEFWRWAECCDALADIIRGQSRWNLAKSFLSHSNLRRKLDTVFPYVSQQSWPVPPPELCLFSLRPGISIPHKIPRDIFASPQNSFDVLVEEVRTAQSAEPES